MFTRERWADDDHGERFLIYGQSGIGKSTLAAMAPTAVFMGVDDGGKRIRHPKTDEKVERIPEVKTFQDARWAVQQTNLFKPGETLVVDTLTKLNDLAIQYVLDTVKLKGGSTATSIKQYGWGDGDAHVTAAIQMFLTDLDKLVAKGVNVILLAQQTLVRVENEAGADYVAASPRLLHTKQGQVRDNVVEWCDHVFRIGFDDLGVVQAENEKTGKVKNTEAGRAVYTSGAAWLVAKTRSSLPSVVDFADKSDNVLWQYMFDQEPYYDPEGETE